MFIWTFLSRAQSQVAAVAGLLVGVTYKYVVYKKACTDTKIIESVLNDKFQRVLQNHETSE